MMLYSCHSQRCALLFAVICLSVLSPSGAAANPGKDEVSALFANRFSFDRRGVPLISVRIMEGQRKVTLTSTGGVLLQPFGTNATRVTGATTWTLTLRKGSAARVRYWVVVERLPGAATRARRRLVLKRWLGRGLKVRTLEVGALFAVGGRVVDNRATFVVASPDPNSTIAAMAARRLAKKAQGAHHAAP